jgi:hypothetical protein
VHCSPTAAAAAQHQWRKIHQQQRQQQQQHKQQQQAQQQQQQQLLAWASLQLAARTRDAQQHSQMGLVNNSSSRSSRDLAGS